MLRDDEQALGGIERREAPALEGTRIAIAELFLRAPGEAAQQSSFGQ